MGLFGNIISASIKTILLPVAVVKDVVNLVEGEDLDATAAIGASIIEDIIDAADNAAKGDL